MKHLVYIGNKLSQTGKTATTIDTLGKGLEAADFEVTYASSYSNILMRFLDMLWTVFIHRKTTDYVLIDTYSTLNFYYAYAVSKLCQWFKLKYIPILHGGNLPIRLKNNPRLCASIFNKSFVNISPSGFIKSEFEAFGYSNIQVIPNSISITNYPFTERTLDNVNLLWVRSFSNLYNPKLAVTILFQLKEIYPEATLCMVGPDNDGSLKSTKAYAGQLGVDVTFTGKLTKAEWIALSAHYSVFINTTNYDNTPVSVIEAMALGLPIVSTNVGGLPYLIEHEKEGVLVNPNHPEAFVEAIKRYKNDSAFRASVIKDARLKAESFDWENIKQQWLTTLK
ncbi:glycosyltransferase family 4 protein [Olleya aquimaris]|uniref:Glycosyltransferase involved in cell wall biosynthesis n=1 Tax=Olleya aquimaris TaxID=639310 RepID=A0A327RIU6_9FLAO|nr:glycosyltransferase family 4 protein [Olleya aquimaris]RAJ17006.1 glycosyltransferase involved in cell wall biosynthesis [Olleya aquimaris]